MARPVPVEPVKYFVAVLYRDPAVLERLRGELVRRWGTIDYEGRDHPFDLTDYYRDEMGESLVRRIVAFERLMPPTELVAMKHACNGIEEQFAIGGRRQVNLDCGYLDHHKVVLASMKGAGHKLYLADGVWGDFTCRWQRGAFQPFEWSFPDFKEGRYRDELARIRERLLAQRKGTTR